MRLLRVGSLAFLRVEPLMSRSMDQAISTHNLPSTTVACNLDRLQCPFRARRAPSTQGADSGIPTSVRSLLWALGLVVPSARAQGLAAAHDHRRIAAPGASGQAVNTNVTATFSEPIQPARSPSVLRDSASNRRAGQPELRFLDAHRDASSQCGSDCLANLYGHGKRGHGSGRQLHEFPGRLVFFDWPAWLSGIRESLAGSTARLPFSSRQTAVSLLRKRAD